MDKEQAMLVSAGPAKPGGRMVYLTLEMAPLGST